MKTSDAATRLEALGNPTRLAIFRLLVRAGGEGLAVGRIQQRLDMPASTLSHHLKALCATGLVRQTRERTTLICTADFKLMRGLVDFLVAECCVESGCAAPAETERAA
jgi:ArsR family transcriptional regulator, arsenate/arsenite/antimonite-responsive transcriptional repressor